MDCSIACRSHQVFYRRRAAAIYRRQCIHGKLAGLSRPFHLGDELGWARHLFIQLLSRMQQNEPLETHPLSAYLFAQIGARRHDKQGERIV